MRTVLIDIRGSLSLDGVFPALRVGEDYYGRVTASGGAPFYRYAVTSGSLPNGLAMDTVTGEVTGTPTDNETDVITITATDIQGMSVSRIFVFYVAPEVYMAVVPAGFWLVSQDSWYDGYLNSLRVQFSYLRGDLRGGDVLQVTGGTRWHSDADGMDANGDLPPDADDRCWDPGDTIQLPYVGYPGGGGA